jgi:methyltransferase family protein
MLSHLRAAKYSLKLWKVLLSDYRYFASVRDGVLTDKDGYIPWFTYPAIEALKTWDLSDKSVLEYGSGYSTLFWARCTKHVVSIEHNPEWFDKVRKLMPSNVDLRLRPLQEYAAIEGHYDVIVVDGYAQQRMRYQCAVASLPHLNPGGLVIVDNSDWLPATCLWLRRAGLIQVDMSGLVPGNAQAQTTSFFFTRDFAFEHAQCVLPVAGTGYNWEPKLEQELLGT